MNSTIHERPGVYSSYDASSVVSASAAAKTIGAAAVATKGTVNKVELITSYEEGKSVFGEDASGVYGMSTLLRFLFANGAGAVKAVAVGKDESEEKDYASAFAALSDEEDVGVMVCDSAAQSVHLLLKTAAEEASAARRERIAVIGGSEETVAQMVNRAKAVNSERVVLVGPDIASDDGGTMSAVFAAAAVAAVIAGNTDPSVPINGAELTLFGAAGKRLSDNEIDQLVRSGVTPIETVGGVSSPVRGITTKTSSGGAADTTWRELTTILIVDEVIPTIRSALRTRFARSKNTAQSRGAIRSQVVLELEEMKSREIVDSYFDKTGALEVKKNRKAARVSIDAKTPVTALAYCDKRYGVIAEALVVDSKAGVKQSVKNEAFCARGGTSRRVFYVPARSGTQAMRYTGEYQIAKSKEGAETLRVTIAGRFTAAPGDIAAVSGTKIGIVGNFRVIECVRRFGESGEACEVTMQRE